MSRFRCGGHGFVPLRMNTTTYFFLSRMGEDRVEGDLLVP